jgi:2-methylcitrate dehydratase PrpD
VANALLRGASRLEHFEEAQIREGKAAELSQRILVIPDKALEKRGHTPMDMRVLTRDGREFERKIDIGPGFPGNPLTKEDHEKRFQDCLAFAKKPISRENAAKITSMIEDLESVEDIRALIPLLVR